MILLSYTVHGHRMPDLNENVKAWRAKRYYDSRLYYVYNGLLRFDVILDNMYLVLARFAHLSLFALLKKYLCVTIFVLNRQCYKVLRLCLVGAAIFPHGAFAESLDDALRAAIDNHPSVAVAQAGYEAAQSDADSAYSNYFPEISVSTALGRVYQDNATSRGLVTDRGAAYSGYGEGNVALRQTIFDGMATQNRIDAANARMDSKKISVLDAQETLVLRVAGSYIDVLRIRAALKLLEEQRKAIKDYEVRILDMAKDGAADEAEVQQAHDVSMIVDGVIVDYQGQLAAAQAGYSEVIGARPSEDLDAPKDLSDEILSDVGQASNLALSEHPALKAMDFEEKAAVEDVDVAKAEFLPTLGGELSYAKVDKKDIIGGESEDKRAVIRMNWNFSTGGKQISDVEKMRHHVAESRARKEDLQRQIERDVIVAYSRLQMFKDKSKISAERVALNEKLFATYETQFEGARINLLGLMRAQSQLFNAKLEDSDNYYNLIGSQYGALAAMGRLKDVLLGKGSNMTGAGSENNAAAPVVETMPPSQKGSL